MANVKEIRVKISSIQSTQKITKAMEMVANSKMRKTQDRMRAGRPYAEMIREMIGHLALANSEIKTPYLEKREVKRVGFLVVSTDRGLCGGLNTNLFKMVLNEIVRLQEQGIESTVGVFGARGVGFFKSIKMPILTQVTSLSEEFELMDLVGPVISMMKAFDKGEIDQLFIVNNQFLNTMAQKPVMQQLLPLPASNDERLQNKGWDYIYEPDAKLLLDEMLKRYVEAQVYQAVVENQASEQAARMVAMKGATDNGANLIKELQIIYNKARQSAITNELIDIVSGAAAVSN